MSGLPPAPGDRTPNWITVSWPRELHALLERQWQVAIGYWRGLVRHADAAGVRLCLELHGHQLVHDVPSLLRLRDEVGATVGANLDPSHLLWMGADPLAAVAALGDALYHVHAKDTRLEPSVAVRGRLETLPDDRPDERAWNFATVGQGHDEAFWAAFVDALAAVGYDDVLSIEHEDARCDPADGVRASVALLQRVIAARVAA
jgi:sugar phosphate isomerase/epimerase